MPGPAGTATPTLAETQRSLLDRAGGNPLYAEQFAELFASEDLQGAVKSFLEEGPGKATFEGA